MFSFPLDASLDSFCKLKCTIDDTVIGRTAGGPSQKTLTCMQTLRNRGGIDEVAPADLARDVRVDRLQLHAPLHAD